MKRGFVLRRQAERALPIRQLHRIEDYVTANLAESERLAELVELSSSHFAHVFKESTGMTSAAHFAVTTT